MSLCEQKRRRRRRKSKSYIEALIADRGNVVHILMMALLVIGYVVSFSDCCIFLHFFTFRIRSSINNLKDQNSDVELWINGSRIKLEYNTRIMCIYLITHCFVRWCSVCVGPMAYGQCPIKVEQSNMRTMSNISFYKIRRRNQSKLALNEVDLIQNKRLKHHTFCPFHSNEWPNRRRRDRKRKIIRKKIEKYNMQYVIEFRWVLVLV